MAKKNFLIKCAACVNYCRITAINIESVSYCPFCGEGIILAYDDVGDEEPFPSAYDDFADDIDDGA